MEMETRRARIGGGNRIIPIMHMFRKVGSGRSWSHAQEDVNVMFPHGQEIRPPWRMTGDRSVFHPDVSQALSEAQACVILQRPGGRRASVGHLVQTSQPRFELAGPYRCFGHSPSSVLASSDARSPW